MILLHYTMDMVSTQTLHLCFAAAVAIAQPVLRGRLRIADKLGTLIAEAPLRTAVLARLVLTVRSFSACKPFSFAISSQQLR